MSGLFTLAVVGLGLSVDAFAAAVGKGAMGKRPQILDALRVGVVFGAFEALTPVFGWAIGLAFADWISAIDHWVAFAMLVAVGSNMLWQSKKGVSRPDAERTRHGFAALAVTAFATSIDAMAVGVSLALLNVDIITACIVIGTVTTVVATCGVLLGRHVGRHFGRYAELVGGLALIGIGCSILFQHLTGRA